MKLLTRGAHIFDRIVDFLAYLGGGAILLIAVLTCSDIMSRWLANVAIQMVAESDELLLLYTTFLGTTWVQKRNAHVRMDLLLSRLKARSQGLVNCVTHTLSAFLCVVLAWYSGAVTWDLAQRGICRPTMLESPLALLTAIVSIGYFLLFIQLSRDAYGYLMSWKESRVKEQGLSRNNNARGSDPDLERRH